MTAHAYQPDDIRVVDCGDSDWHRIEVCNEGIGHEWGLYPDGDGYRCVNCGALGEDADPDDVAGDDDFPGEDSIVDDGFSI